MPVLVQCPSCSAMVPPELMVPFSWEPPLFVCPVCSPSMRKGRVPSRPNWVPPSRRDAGDPSSESPWDVTAEGESAKTAPDYVETAFGPLNPRHNYGYISRITDNTGRARVTREPVPILFIPQFTAQGNTEVPLPAHRGTPGERDQGQHNRRHARQRT
jgi:hypothetical protein